MNNEDFGINRFIRIKRGIYKRRIRSTWNKMRQINKIFSRGNIYNEIKRWQFPLSSSTIHLSCIIHRCWFLDLLFLVCAAARGLFILLFSFFFLTFSLLRRKWRQKRSWWRGARSSPLRIHLPTHPSPLNASLLHAAQDTWAIAPSRRSRSFVAMFVLANTRTTDVRRIDRSRRRRRHYKPHRKLLWTEGTTPTRRLHS